MQPKFDAAGFYEFDLAHGAVRAKGGGRVVVLEDAALALMLAGGSPDDALTSIGRSLGESARASLSEDPGTAYPEIVAAHAAGVLALSGFGRLTLERWGDTLALRLEDAPSIDLRSLGSLLSGLFSALAHLPIACVPIVDQPPRFAVVDPSVADEVAKIGAQGMAAVAGALGGTS